MAGSDTTAAELVAFVQALLLFPDVQKKAQEELDRVCGDRYPTKEDAEALPYICSCIKEVCRWVSWCILRRTFSLFSLFPTKNTQDLGGLQDF